MFKRILSLMVFVCFFITSLCPFPQAKADIFLNLPRPGTMVNLSPTYEPVIIKGLTVHKDNPFLFDFIVDVGQDKLSGEPLKKEGEKLIKYFLASLAIPDKDVWVNLSPYEKDRMIPEALGQTDMGRDLLEQDYILKQITASLIYPEKNLGKKFWDKVYAKAQEMYGTTQVPVNTFNKVWIMADRAEVFEHNQTAFVVDSHLKVMLEEDYLALSRHVIPAPDKNIRGQAAAGIHKKNDIHSVSSQIVRSIILPELEKEVNTGKNFADLRQIFNSIILSSWYKINLKQALLTQVYANKAKIKGIERDVIPAPDEQLRVSVNTTKNIRGQAAAGIQNQDLSPDQIYQQYLKAYKKGVFNYIKEDTFLHRDGEGQGGVTIPRKYFSGGINEAMAAHPALTTNPNTLIILQDKSMIDMAVGLNTAPENDPPKDGRRTDNIDHLFEKNEVMSVDHMKKMVERYFGKNVKFMRTRKAKEWPLKFELTNRAAGMGDLFLLKAKEKELWGAKVLFYKVNGYLMISEPTEEGIEERLDNFLKDFQVQIDERVTPQGIAEMIEGSFGRILKLRPANKWPVKFTLQGQAAPMLGSFIRMASRDGLWGQKSGLIHKVKEFLAIRQVRDKETAESLEDFLKKFQNKITSPITVQEIEGMISPLGANVVIQPSDAWPMRFELMGKAAGKKKEFIKLAGKEWWGEDKLFFDVGPFIEIRQPTDEIDREELEEFWKVFKDIVDYQEYYQVLKDNEDKINYILQELPEKFHGLNITVPIDIVKVDIIAGRIESEKAYEDGGRTTTNDLVLTFKVDPSKPDFMPLFLDHLEDVLAHFFPEFHEFAKIGRWKQLRDQYPARREIAKKLIFTEEQITEIREEMRKIELALGTQGATVEQKVDQQIQKIIKDGRPLTGINVDVYQKLDGQAPIIGAIDQSLADRFGYVFRTVTVVFQSNDGKELGVIQRGNGDIVFPGKVVKAGRDADFTIRQLISNEIDIRDLDNKPIIVGNDYYERPGVARRQIRTLLIYRFSKNETSILQTRNRTLVKLQEGKTRAEFEKDSLALRTAFGRDNISQVLFVPRDIIFNAKEEPYWNYKIKGDGGFKGRAHFLIIKESFTDAPVDGTKLFFMPNVVDTFFSNDQLMGDLKKACETNDAMSAIELAEHADSAMLQVTRNQAFSSSVIAPEYKGGIDLNTSNGMDWKDRRDGLGIEMDVNPAMIAQARREGIDWLSPEILRMTPVRSIWSVVGLPAPAIK